MVLPREFSTVEQSKALSTLGCQVLCLCFSEPCPGSPWKANNLWVAAEGAKSGENEICFHCHSVTECLLCWWCPANLDSSLLWGTALPEPLLPPWRGMNPVLCCQGSSSSTSLAVRDEAAEPFHGTNLFISHHFSLAALGLSPGGGCEGSGVTFPSHPGSERKAWKRLFLSLG